MTKALTVAALQKLRPGDERREIPDGLLRGLYFVIQPTGQRSWAVRYRAKGKPRKLTLGSYPAIELDDARTAARVALLAAQRGGDPAAEKQAARRRDALDDRRFGKVLLQYFSRDATKNRSWRETARLLGLAASKDDGVDADDPLTYGAVAGGVAKDWGDHLVADIRKRDVLRRLDAIVDRGSPIVANRTLSALRRFFAWCIERDLIDKSPCLGVKAPADEESRDRVLTDDEIRWFWMATDKMGYPFGKAARLLLLTLQRREEVGGMSRQEIEGSVWTIPAARAKNNEIHQVPLSAAALVELASMPTVSGRRGLLFTTNGERPISGWSRAKAHLDAAMLEIARKEAGGDSELVVIPPWRLHDLRRTGSTGMARLGVPVHVAEKFMNHLTGSISGVAKIYNRFDYMAERVSAAQAWSGLLAQITSRSS